VFHLGDSVNRSFCSPQIASETSRLNLVPEVTVEDVGGQHEKPARRRAVIRVFRARMIASAPSTSNAITIGGSAPGTPNDDM
jgi:hypothetical protein